MAGRGALPDAVVAAAHRLAVDAAGAEAVRALEESGVRSILLKGPALAAWLYDRGEARSYTDVDLLIAPRDWVTAEQVLTGLDFVWSPSSESKPRRGLPHSERWLRASDGAKVDLHRTVSGVPVSPEKAWEVLCEQTETMAVGGSVMEVLAPHARALVVASHAVQHAGQHAQPLRDLARAVERLSDDVWSEAARLAERLQATHTLASGLRLLPAGSELAERLGLVDAEIVEQADSDSSTLVLGLERLARAHGTRARLGLLAREVVPSPADLRWWSATARRGAVGLAVVYAWRPLWLLWHLPPSLRAWRRGRRGGAGTAAS